MGNRNEVNPQDRSACSALAVSLTDSSPPSDRNVTTTTDLEIVAINDLGSPETCTYLTRYDSVLDDPRSEQRNRSAAPAPGGGASGGRTSRIVDCGQRTNFAVGGEFVRIARSAVRSELSMRRLFGRTRRPHWAYATASFLNGRLYRRLGTCPGAAARDRSPEPVLPIARAESRADDGTGLIRFNCRLRAWPSWLLLRPRHSPLGGS